MTQSQALKTANAKFERVWALKQEISTYNHTEPSIMYYIYFLKENPIGNSDLDWCKSNTESWESLLEAAEGDPRVQVRRV